MMRSILFRTFLISLAATVVTVGCAAPGGVARVPGDEQFRCDLTPQALVDKLNISERAKYDKALNFLLLSGGGARGAWGAGYLKGWKKPKDDKEGVRMPPFDVVTGVSTGALQATYAFVGDYESIYEIYTTTKSDQVWKKRFLLSVPFSNSLLKSSPLAELIKSRVGDKLVMEVAAKSKGRLLCVAAVNLDTGEFREWDLTAIAVEYKSAGKDSPRGKELINLYRMVLLASAAIPVAFPPVEISDAEGSALYVDGGTRENVFVAFGRLLDFALTTNVQAFGLDGDTDLRIADLVRFNVFVIVNGQIGIAPASVGNHVIPIALRSLDALMAESMNGAIYHIDHELSKRGARDVFKTRYTYIPSDECLENSSLEFDPTAMTRQAKLAATFGRDLMWFEFDPNSKLEKCKPQSYTK